MTIPRQARPSAARMGWRGVATILAMLAGTAVARAQTSELLLIRDIEGQLIRLHYLEDSEAGLSEKRTRAAISRFELASGLPLSGEVSPDLLARLRAAPTAPPSPSTSGTDAVPTPAVKTSATRGLLVPRLWTAPRDMPRYRYDKPTHSLLPDTDPADWIATSAMQPVNFGFGAYHSDRWIFQSEPNGAVVDGLGLTKPIQTDVQIVNLDGDQVAGMVMTLAGYAPCGYHQSTSRQLSKDGRIFITVFCHLEKKE